MAKKVVAKKRIGRPPGRRPVLAIRVHLSLHEQLQQAAKFSRSTLAAEAERRLTESFEWERASQDFSTWKAKQRSEAERDLRAALTSAGYQPVMSAAGRVWAEPDVEIDRISEHITATLDDAIERAVVRAMSKVQT